MQVVAVVCCCAAAAGVVCCRAVGVESRRCPYKTGLALDPNWHPGSTHALSLWDSVDLGGGRVRVLPEVPRPTGLAGAGEESSVAELLAVERAGWSEPPRYAALGGTAAVVVGVGWGQMRGSG